MYKFVVVSVIALVVIQGALARPKAKQGAAPKAQPSQIDELAEQARDVIRNVSGVLEGNLPSSDQVSQTLVEGSQKLSNQIKITVDDLAKQAQEHKGDLENVLNKIKESLENTRKKLQEAVGPEAAQKAKEIKANLDQGLNNVVSEAEKLAQAAKPELEKTQNDLNNFAKDVLNKVVEFSKGLQSDLNKNLQSPPK